jgi:hypothetical protein
MEHRRISVPAQSWIVRRDRRIPARCDDRSRRPVPDHGDRPRADRHAAARRTDDRDDEFRHPDLAGRPDPSSGVAESPFLRPWTVCGATFEYVAGPTRPIEGVVRDRETGRPLADILVYAGRSSARPASTVRTLTGADGRYRLVGLPLGREGELVAAPACDLSAGRNWFGIDPRFPADLCPPHFEAAVSVPKSPGKEPVHLDIALNRGVRVTGRILDRDTRKPVSGRVAYLAFDDNPHRSIDPDLGRRSNIHFTNVDGVFRLVIPPGPGVLAAYVFGPYVRGVGVAAIHSRRPDWVSHIRRGFRFPNEYHVFQWVEPAPDASSVTQDLRAERP